VRLEPTNEDYFSELRPIEIIVVLPVLNGFLLKIPLRNKHYNSFCQSANRVEKSDVTLTPGWHHLLRTRSPSEPSCPPSSCRCAWAWVRIRTWRACCWETFLWLARRRSQNSRRRPKYNIFRLEWCGTVPVANRIQPSFLSHGHFGQNNYSACPWQAIHSSLTSYYSLHGVRQYRLEWLVRLIFTSKAWNTH
jgi:hypothetical protein